MMPALPNSPVDSSGTISILSQRQPNARGGQRVIGTFQVPRPLQAGIRAV